jgi:uncharacterized protein YndB with AHSA1/START domain
MIDIVRQIEAVEREVGSGRLADHEASRVRLRRTLDAPIDDVWDALTDPARIGRWFLPISGDFRVGGRYQFEGNAGGEILDCDRPNRLRASWVMGEGAGASSEVEVRLTSAGASSTVFEFEHIAVVPDEFWNEYGPGAVGVGWDGGMLGLVLHLAGTRDTIGDPEAWQLSDEGREFNRLSSEAWGEAYRATGANPELVARGVANTTAFYAPEPATR